MFKVMPDHASEAESLDFFGAGKAVTVKTVSIPISVYREHADNLAEVMAFGAVCRTKVHNFSLLDKIVNPFESGQ